MTPGARLVSLAVAVGLAAAACASAPPVDLVADAGRVVAPASDARLADVGYPGAAAWVRDEVARSGRPVLVKFFASWCGPCEAEAPVLLDAVAEHPEVAVLGVDHQDRPEAARAWIAEHGLDSIPTVADVEGEVARALGARGMPSMSFVDDRGRLVHTHTGPISPPLLEAWIDHLAHGGPRPSARPDAPSSDTPP